jgi:hypothetical protein
MSERIAYKIWEAYPEDLRISVEPIAADKSKGSWIQRPRNVLAAYRKYSPVVLIETCYISNEYDMFLWSNPAVQSAVVSAILCGVDGFRCSL